MQVVAKYFDVVDLQKKQILLLWGIYKSNGGGYRFMQIWKMEANGYVPLSPNMTRIQQILLVK